MPGDGKVSLSVDLAGPLLVIHDPPAEAARWIESALTYTSMQRVYERGRSESVPQTIVCYRYLGSPRRLVAPRGYLSLLERRLADRGWKLEVTDRQPHPRPQVYEPCWEAADAMGPWRHGQREALEAICRHDRGLIECPTGWGKTHLIRRICALFPQARIDIICRSAEVIRSIWISLMADGIDVGLVGAGSRQLGRPTTCYCAGSLGYTPGNADIVLADEVHELATPRVLEALAKYRWARMFGLSASLGKRFDRRDFELTGVFGEQIASISYQQAASQGDVAQVEVLWVPVRLGVNPAAHYEGEVARKRHGIWRNRARNEIIAEVISSVPHDLQLLVCVESLEHALRIRQLCPDLTAVYAHGARDPERWERWRRQGLVREGEEPLTLAERERIRQMFERAELKRCVCTSVWSRGVDFRHLRVLIWASGSASVIQEIQVPGRLSRRHGDKQVGLLVDFQDFFDTGFDRRWRYHRRSQYAAMGWRQFVLGRIPQAGESLLDVPWRVLGDGRDVERRERKGGGTKLWSAKRAT